MKLVIKRIFDLVFSFLILFAIGWLLLILILLASVDTKSLGLFIQRRVGQHGKCFKIFKIKSISDDTQKVSSIGQFLRKSKLDELPQLVNILLGEMSFVGPRPDIQGYYDDLQGESRKVLELKPGLTSEASIKYADEEQLLRKKSNALKYNDEIIFPDKVKMNLAYYYKHNIILDLKIIIKTIFTI